MSRLQEKYQKEITGVLAKEFSIKNKMAVPSVKKVVVNSGIGKGMKDVHAREALASDIAKITGQKPSVRVAKVSVSAFSLREGMPVGLKVTLRGVKMYDFLDKLFSIVLPRLRDFRGVKSNSFDKSGNYTLGIVEHTIFPEIDIAKSAAPHGMEITIVSNSDSVDKSRRLLELMGMPFEKK